MKLGPVYHWSPSKNREKILKEGLTILNSEIEYENPVTGKNETWKPGYLCTSLDPWLAFLYVRPMFEDGNCPDLDLFQFEPSEKDDVVLRNDHTNEVIEVRIRNSISAERIHYIATREGDA